MTVSEYLDGLAHDTRQAVSDVLDAVRAGLPGAEERVRYGMPAVMLDGATPCTSAGGSVTSACTPWRGSASRWNATSPRTARRRMR